MNGKSIFATFIRERTMIGLLAGLAALVVASFIFWPASGGTRTGWPDGWRCFFTGSSKGQVCVKRADENRDRTP